MRFRHLLARALCALWTVGGLVLSLGWLRDLGGDPPSLASVLVGAGLTALVVAFSHVAFDFGAGGRRLELGPGTAVLVLAAVLLPPPVAALIALVGTSRRAWQQPNVWRRVFHCANAAFAIGTAGILLDAVRAGDVSGRIVLPAAFVLAAVNATLTIAGQMLFEEARETGGAHQLAHSTPLAALALHELALPIAAVSMAGPFLTNTPQAFAVVTAVAVFDWLVLRGLHRDFRQGQENTYLRDTFSRYVPTNVADRLLTGPGGQVALGGQQLEITVMFVDVRGFTTWAEQNQPDDVIAELNQMLTDIADAIIATDGTIDKFTGDGLMAFWGAPTPQSDHAARALKAVPGMLMRVRERNIKREARRKPPLEIGVGIHTGLAMVGNVGHRDRLDYTAVGDTVNLAARLEKATKDASCPLLLSEATFLSLPLSMQRQLARMESIGVKGRRDRVRLYTLTSFARARRAELDRRRADAAS